MKLNLLRFFSVSLLVSVLLLGSCSASHESSSEFVHWRPYAEGLQTAGNQGKNVFLYFRADW